MLGNTTLGFSTYQAGIVKVEKHTGHGLTLNANLTWSHTLSTVGINQEYTQANASVPFDLRYDYGPAPFDTRWVFNMLAYYQLPFGKGHKLGGGNAVVDKIIGGGGFAPLLPPKNSAVMGTPTGPFTSFVPGDPPSAPSPLPLQPTNQDSRSP